MSEAWCKSRDEQEQEQEQKQLGHDTDTAQRIRNLTTERPYRAMVGGLGRTALEALVCEAKICWQVVVGCAGANTLIRARRMCGS